MKEKTFKDGKQKNQQNNNNIKIIAEKRGLNHKQYTEEDDFDDETCERKMVFGF